MNMSLVSDTHLPTLNETHGGCIIWSDTCRELFIEGMGDRLLRPGENETLKRGLLYLERTAKMEEVDS